MEFDEWEPFYRRIAAQFGFSRQADEAAARRLALVLAKDPYRPGVIWSELEARVRGRPVIILGAADDAATALARHRTDEPVFAADGATTAALEAHVNPTAIVTDLDGNVDDEVEAAHHGSRVLVHAHGDNGPAIARWLPKFQPRSVAGTCQTRPMAPLRNLGGFTDGDRACFIAHALGATSLRLVGFSLEGKPGRYTGTFDPKTKPQKMEWAGRLLGELAARGALIETL